MPKRSQHNTREKAMAAQRANQMMELFIRGASYEQIAEQYEIGYNRVCAIINRQLEQIPSENRELARKKLDGTVRVVLRKAMKGVNDGDPHAMQIALNCVDRLAKLHGAYAPEIKEVEVFAGEDSGAVVRQPRIIFTEAVEVPAEEPAPAQIAVGEGA